MLFGQRRKLDDGTKEFTQLRQALRLAGTPSESEPPSPPSTDAPATRPTPGPAIVTRPLSASPTSPDQFTCVLSRGSLWQGSLKIQGSVRIDGQLSGEIEASDAIYIAEDAVVAAQVEAAIVIIAGRFEGKVRCRERLEVLASGRATAELTTPSLVVHEGAVIQGMVQMDEARRPASETTANHAQPDGPAASATRASRPAHRPESPEPASSTATDQGATTSG